MKKLIIILIGLGLIAGLSYMAMNFKKSSKITDTSLIAFAVEDTASVDKIEIYDSYTDQEYVVERDENGVWKGPNGECVQQNIIQMMLETMYKITLKGYVPKSAMKNMKKVLMANHKTVRIFQDGDWAKTWYVGHSTQDHMGTHMLLETPDLKSDNPVIMGMKGFYGILEPRFFSDPRRFQCLDLFSYKRSELNTVELIDRVNPQSSFKVNAKNPDNIQVTSNGRPVHNINKDNLIFYLNGFENINFNQPNYTLSVKEIDSIKTSKPDYELLIDAKKSSYKLDLYRRFDPSYEGQDTLAYDEDFLWAVKADGELVRMQYYTVGPLIRGKMIFANE
ncbi:hypothetical protein [Brumimicrobium aurantiacum]|nr:hypothetical protein [Brumimicrobium aurantiacum]